MKMYVVLMLCGSSAQPVFHGDPPYGKNADRWLKTFLTKKAAKEEITDLIDSVNEAIKAGDMDKESKVCYSDYEIVPCEDHGDFIDVEFEGVHYTMNKEDDDWGVMEYKD